MAIVMTAAVISNPTMADASITARIQARAREEFKPQIRRSDAGAKGDDEPVRHVEQDAAENIHRHTA